MRANIRIDLAYSGDEYDVGSAFGLSFFVMFTDGIRQLIRIGTHHVVEQSQKLIRVNVRRHLHMATLLVPQHAIQNVAVVKNLQSDVV